jgi:hypothetical protein
MTRGMELGICMNGKSGPRKIPPASLCFGLCNTATCLFYKAERWEDNVNVRLEYRGVPEC